MAEVWFPSALSMKSSASLLSWPRSLGLGLAVAGLAVATALGQPPLADVGDPARESPLFRSDILNSKLPAEDRRSSRFRLFCMQPGFLYDPVGLDDDEPAESDPAVVPAQEEVDVDGRLTVSMGMVNPYFDFRRRGDPDGVGFYKVHTQFQLLDTGTTGLSLGFQGVTPAGLASQGVERGATVVRPNLGWYHEQNDGLGWQGFISKDIRAAPGWEDSMGHSIQYGVGMHWPGPDLGSPVGRVNGFVELLGRYRYVDSPGTQALSWELLPGVFWKLDETTWIALGMIEPVDAPPRRSRLWQLTCSWRFGPRSLR